ncbi:MAG: hypothetical protein NT001_05660, partial [Candidatus Woesearchaeota archaeon]|nr:hypothetical protein [Candidatus Woesearchaeota archaeon]
AGPVIIVKSASKDASKGKTNEAEKHAESRKSKMIKKADIQEKVNIQKEVSKADASEEKEKEQAKPAEPLEERDGEHTQLKTALDDLYSCVQQNGNITLSDAASKLKTGREKIEEWAKILDDHGLIKRYYPAFTGPQLISMEWLKNKDKEEEKKKASKTSRRNNGENEEANHS